MRKFGLGIVLGACLVAVLVLVSSQDIFKCALFIMMVGFLLMSFRQN